nr:unnamed protein product [Callosobruchus chinensis]
MIRGQYLLLPTQTDEVNSAQPSTGQESPRTAGDTLSAIGTRQQSYNHLKIASFGKLEINDIVRVSKSKHLFEKGYTPNWTTELFKIVKVNISSPVTYMLEDMNGDPIKGALYEEELQKTLAPDIYLVEKVLKRKDGKMYVKWLGFDSNKSSWVKEADIV